jgi:hypothetical protein
VFYGLRTAPKEDVHSANETLYQVAMVAHMGGEPLTVTLGDWLQIDLDEWKVAIASPGVKLNNTSDELRSFELRDSQSILLERVG